MDFVTWTRTLADRGLRVLSPSHPAPVELWAQLPDATVVHFRCRGTEVRLERYAQSDVLMVAPAESCDCGHAHLVATDGATRVLPRPGAHPLETLRWDGGRERGWTSYEAGLLRVADAAALFDRLLAGAQPVATGRDESAVQFDHEPTYSAAGTPAILSAKTS